jgi:hypothetical protein
MANETFSPFDSIKKLSETKELHTQEELAILNQWMVIRGFSMDKGTILYADAINRTGLSNQMVHDWFLTALPKKRFFAKWSKASKADERLKMVQQKYQCNRNTALEYISLMNDSDFDRLEESMSAGGKDKK